jgi:adenine-specific DNA-methyltransferase
MSQLALFELESTTFPTNKQPADRRKLRGSYYTPLDLARYLVQWGIRADTQRILEPSCGDGNFVAAILNHLQAGNGSAPKPAPDMVAVELDEAELRKAQQRIQTLPQHGAAIEWLNADFFSIYPHLRQGKPFNLIVGNPPFIRFQHFDNNSRDRAFSHLSAIGYNPTKVANIWTAFVQLCVELLCTGGRLAMVLPAELLQVKYAQELRDRLTTNFDHIVIVGFKRLVFPEIQQEVVLLLAEGKRGQAGPTSDVHTVEFADGEDLLRHENVRQAVAHVPARHSRPGMKWTSLFLDADLFAALDIAARAPGLISLGALAAVDVGIVTGRNSFFVLTEAQRAQLDVERLTKPIIGRTAALKTTRFTPEDFAQYSLLYPAFLLNLTGVAARQFSPSLEDYLHRGETQQINLGYKCRIRRRWYDVPSIYTPDAFLFRQIHRYPLLVVNQAEATSTDTIHRVRLRPGVDAQRLAAAFFNSLTLAWAEVCGRSYGGGVLELEPREAEELPIPYHGELAIDADKVTSLLAQGQPYEALNYVDDVVLRDHLGFDAITLRHLRGAWEQLRDRRIERK